MFGEPLDIGIGNLILHLQGTDQKLAGLKINFLLFFDDCILY